MSQSREQKSYRLRRIREQVDENFRPLREAVIPSRPPCMSLSELSVRLVWT